MRQHFLVNGDELDVLIYGSAGQAEGEARRIRDALGGAPLAARSGVAASAPASYVVVGPVLIRHRGADPEVRSRLEAAFGPLDPVAVPGFSPNLGEVAAAPCLYTYACPDQPGERPGAPAYPEYLYRPRLYQGDHVPAWTLRPTPQGVGVRPVPAVRPPDAVGPAPVPAGQ